MGIPAGCDALRREPPRCRERGVLTWRTDMGETLIEIGQTNHRHELLAERTHAMCAERGIPQSVSVITNGLLLTPEVVDRLQEELRHVERVRREAESDRRMAAEARVQQPMGLVHGGAFAALAESTQQLRGWESKCIVIPYGIDMRPDSEAIARRAEEIRKAERRPIVLFVGRLVRYKGADVLLDAIQIVMTGMNVALAGVVANNYNVADRPRRR